MINKEYLVFICCVHSSLTNAHELALHANNRALQMAPIIGYFAAGLAIGSATTGIIYPLTPPAPSIHFILPETPSFLLQLQKNASSKNILITAVGTSLIYYLATKNNSPTVYTSISGLAGCIITARWLRDS